MEESSVKSRVLKILGDLIGKEFLSAEVTDNLSLAVMGLDPDDKKSFLSYRLRQEFDSNFGDVTNLNTFGELLACVEDHVKNPRY